MTLVMSLAVVPFGVLAALYLREYAKAGPVVSAVRIAAAGRRSTRKSAIACERCSS